MRRYILLLFFVLCFCFTSKAEARKIALLVGVDDYANVSSLNCCVNDMRMLQAALLKVGFNGNDIFILTTGGAVRDLPTKENIENKVAEIIAAAQPNDLVFFAFSGHGARENKTDYFCPPFANLNNLEGTCVSITKMMDDLSKSQAKFKWMVVDACRSDVNNSRDARAFQVIPAPPAGIALFQSCDKDEMSYEENRKGGNGYFTKNLAAALSGEADANHDGELTLLEVCSWTSARTQTEVKKAENKTQRPFLNLAAADFTISVDLNVPKAKTLLAEARKAVQAGDYKLAMKKINEAIALYPRNEGLKREREYIQKLLDAKSGGNPTGIIVPDNCATIEEAYKNVQDGGIITIQPGKYELSKTLVVNRPVTFRGRAGQAEEVVIDCPSSNAFKITGGSPSFQNLTVKSGAEDCCGFLVTGGVPKLFNCIVTSCTAGMVVVGENANPQVDSCTFKNCGGSGALVYDKGRGSFNNCDFYGNAYAGIEVKTSGNPTVTRCKIHDGIKGGVKVSQRGLGLFKDCDISKNARSGIGIETFGNPTFTGCKIHDGNQNGAYIWDNGLGKFIDCDFYGDALSEITIISSGNPTVTGCKIHDGKQNGVLSADNGLGSFADCVIYGNALSGIEVRNSGNPTIAGCKIQSSRQCVFVHSKGMGTFNDNTLQKDAQTGLFDKFNYWKISSDAGEVKGSGNAPPIP